MKPNKKGGGNPEQRRNKMKTTVVITRMNGQGETVKNFATENQARNYFYEWCDEHGYTYGPESNEAGGIGHDYRIEITD